MNDALQVLRENGLLVDAIDWTGAIVRCPVDDKPHGKDGAYMAFSDNPATIWWQNWKTGATGTWCEKSNTAMSEAERQALQARMEASKAQREAEQQQRHAEAAQKAQHIYSNASDYTYHAYLEHKGVSACQGMKLARDGRLMLPLTDQHGQIASLQFIDDAGQKRFLTGGKKAGCFFPIGREPGKPLLLCEGLATGLSLREATGNPVLVAFDCGNLMAVATVAREKYPQRKIVVCADNDATTPNNPGLIAATAAAKAINGLLATPPSHEGRPTDFNDLHQWRGIDAVRACIEAAAHPESTESAKQRKSVELRCLDVSEFLSKNFPVREFILKPVLPRQGLAMLHAARGVGKTFIALSVAYAVASGGKVFDRWGAPRPARVLLIDGEMPAPVLQERLAALVAGNDQEPPTADYLRILTPDLQEGPMPNLATREGQIAVEPFLHGVDLVIVDNLATLARAGRSNDEESWLPVQSWLLDLRRRGLSVLMVHHQGKNGEQRGTSAKEDILDTSIRLKRPADYQADQGARFEVHLTKARGICGSEANPFEAQLYTEENGLSWVTRDLQDVELQHLKTLLGEGMSIRDCAEEMGISKSKAGRLKKRLESEASFTEKTFNVSPGGMPCTE